MSFLSFDKVTPWEKALTDSALKKRKKWMLRSPDRLFLYAKRSRLNSFILVAFLVISTFLSLPNWVAVANRWRLRGFLDSPIAVSGDLPHYLARSRKVWNCQDFSALVGANHENLADGLNNVIELFFFSWGCKLSLSSNTFAIYLFSLVFVTTLISLITFYLLFRKILGGKIIAAFALILFIMVNNSLDSFSIELPNAFELERWPIPPLHYILINVFLLNILEYVNSKRRLFSLSLLFGLSFYVYFYTWQIVLAILLVMLLMSLVTKQRARVKHYTIVTCLGIGIAFPSILNLLEIRSASSRGIAAQFFRNINGVTYDREVSISLYMILGLALTLFIYRWPFGKDVKLLRVFTVLVALTSIVIYNQNVVTGISIQKGHYFWYFIKPYTLLLLLLVLMELISTIVSKKGTQNLKTIFVSGTLVALLLLFIANINAYSGERFAKYFYIPYESISDWRPNIMTFEDVESFRVAINAPNGLTPITFMIYYPGTLNSAYERCIMESIWKAKSIESTDVIAATGKSTYCNFLSQGNPELLEKAKSEILILEPLKYWNKWLSKNEVQTFLTNSITTNQQFLLDEALFRRISYGVYIRGQA